MSSEATAIVPGHSMLDGHVKPHKAEDGKTYHVFAMVGQPPFEHSDDYQQTINIEIPIGPVWIGLQGYIDTSSVSINAELYIKVPLFGQYELGSINGNLSPGISMTFGISGIITGTSRIYINGRTLMLDLSADIFLAGHVGPISIPLLPI